MKPLQRFVSIPAGALTNAGSVQLGSFDPDDPRSRYELRKLRVVPLEPYASQLSCVLTLPGGAQLGPIDLPMALNVECPVIIVVTCPTPDAAVQTVMCTIADLPDSPNLYCATRLEVTGRGGVDIAIPPGVVAVTGYDAATLTFKTAAGATICTAAAGASQLVARPRLAQLISSSAANSAILFHY